MDTTQVVVVVVEGMGEVTITLSPAGDTSLGGGKATRNLHPQRCEQRAQQSLPSDESFGRRDVHRNSTTMLPVALVAAVDQLRRESNRSAGSILVEVINAHMSDLPVLLGGTTAATAAGFRTRERALNARQENTTQLSYRMSREDFARLDHLVAELGARDRTHLIRTALNAHFPGASLEDE